MRAYNYEDKYIYLKSIDEDKDKVIFYNILRTQHLYNELDKPINIYHSSITLSSLKKKEAYFAFEKETNDLIGMCGLLHYNEQNKSADIYFLVNDKIDYDKRINLGEKSLNLYLNYLYDNLSINSIISKTSDNDEVLKYIYNSNMNYLGTTYLSSNINDKFYNTIYYQTTRNDFLKKEKIKEIENTSSGKKLSYSISDLPIYVPGEKISLVRPLDVIYKKLDEEKLLLFINNKNTVKLLGGDLTSSKEILKDYLFTMDYWIMKNDNLIGYINSFSKDKINRTGNLEYAILDPKCRNNGYSKEALSLFKDALFQSKLLYTLNSEVFDFNTISNKVMNSSNMSLVGTRKEGYFLNGNYRDINIYSTSFIKEKR